MSLGKKFSAKMSNEKIYGRTFFEHQLFVEP